jgi:endonuclease-3
MDRKEKARRLLRFLKRRYFGRHGAVEESSESVFEVLVSCVLSQRTKDEKTEIASARLFRKANTPQKILKLSPKELVSLIKPAGFYNQKAKKIRALSKILIDKYDGIVPDTRDELMELPGVGPKTAAIVQVYGYGQSVIPVDVHVEVVAKRLGLVPEKMKPEKVQFELEGLVPEKERYPVNYSLVKFGKEICRTARPRCEVCPLTEICVYYKRVMKKRFKAQSFS